MMEAKMLIMSLISSITLFCAIILIFLHFKLIRHIQKLKSDIKKVDHLSKYNPVTKLPNYLFFLKNCRLLIKKTETSHQNLALLYLDIDHFKTIQVTLGHHTSNLLLVEFANRLLVLLKNQKKHLAHLSFDQFTILFLYSKKDTNAIQLFINQLFTVLRRPFLISGQELNISIAIGIAQFPKHTEKVKILLKYAGIACSFAKQLGYGNYCFYTLGMDTKTNQNRIFLNHLSKAVTNNELVICYQPKIDIQSRKIIGAEALLEWHSKALGKISPNIFIPLAEQAGFIIEIGDFVLKEACKQAKSWHEAGFSDFKIAINLSAFQFKTGDIAERIASIIWNIQLNPRYVELELTESLIMENIEKALLMFKVLKTMGIQISIDDFGTGYSSLSQLKKIPVDSLKIDQSFIRPLNHFNYDNADCAMVLTMITMAKQLGIKIIAEGVETEAQYQFLKEAGADIAQGYLFSKPLPAEQFILLLKENRF